MSVTGVLQRSRDARHAAPRHDLRSLLTGTSWQSGYRRRVAAMDALVVVAATFAGLAVASGGPRPAPSGDQVVLVVAVVLGWLTTVALTKGYEVQSMVTGTAGYRRVFVATWHVFAVVAVALVAVGWLNLLGFAFVAFPVGVLLLLGVRWTVTRSVARRRRRGECTTPVVAVGRPGQVEHLVLELNSRPSGYRVVGVCLSGEVPEPPAAIAGVPVLGGLDDVGGAATRHAAEMVMIHPSDAISPDRLRRLGWELEPTGVGISIATELADTSAARITVVPERSVTLMNIDPPQFRGWKYLVKDAMDRVGAGLLIVLALPVLVVCAVAVATTSPGPVLFRQTRVGRYGEPFSMLKFRTMRVGADTESAVLLAANDGDGVLFKRHDDPRVTKVGRVLRRYSLDELPQLVNVLLGDMSLVGPRPSLPHEVEAYEARMRRRLLVKPGLTGLWQVSGRSDLPHEEAVRLDVYYAENWTPAGDTGVLARTVRAVVTGRGAY